MFNKPDHLILTLELKRMTDVTVSIHIRLVFNFVYISASQPYENMKIGPIK